MESDLRKLARIANEIERLEFRLKEMRNKRNEYAIQLTNSGRYSLRKVAQHADITNVYLVQLRQKKGKNV